MDDDDDLVYILVVNDGMYNNNIKLFYFKLWYCIAIITDRLNFSGSGCRLLYAEIEGGIFIVLIFGIKAQQKSYILKKQVFLEICMYVCIQQISPSKLHDLGDFCPSFHIQFMCYG